MCLTRRVAARIVNLMRRKVFAAAVGIMWSVPAAAQDVPGRDLLFFPLGTAAEAPPLAAQSSGGLWNPAMIELRPGARARIGVATIDSPADQGVTSRLIAFEMLAPRQLTVGISLARASVDDLVRTETDPQSLGTIPYATTVASLAVARQTRRHVAAGLALRYRHGEMDGLRRSALGLDGGIVIDELTSQDIRVGVSSFLWRPGSGPGEFASLLAAADVRVMGTEDRKGTRIGYGISYTSGLATEQYGMASLRNGAMELRAGTSRTSIYDVATWRFRLGLGLYYARYGLGVAREDSGAGLGPTYQFTLSSTIE